jgi:hypothetical protein
VSGSTVRFRPARVWTAAAAAIALVVAAVGAIQGGASAAGPAITALSSQASASGLPVGSPIFATAVLGFAVNPTGTITLSLHDVDDPVCGDVPIFTSTVPVTANGTYTSASLRLDLAGTYRWVARYSGDVNNKSAMSLCSNSGAAVALVRRTPTISSDASTIDATGAATNTAVLTGGGPSGPTGSMTFRLFGVGNLTCAGAPVFTSVKPVAGSGTYTSDPYRPTASGSYQWVVTYSGDTNNNAVGTVCSDTANNVVASGASSATANSTPTTTTTTSTTTTTTTTTTTVPVATLTPALASALGPAVGVTPGSLRGGEYLTVNWSGLPKPSATDWVALFASGATDSAVKVWKYTNGAASGSIPLKVPYGSIGGAYEVRLFSNGTTTRLAVVPVTVL